MSNMSKKFQTALMVFISMVTIALATVTGVYALSTLNFGTSGGIQFGQDSYPLVLELNGGEAKGETLTSYTYSDTVAFVLPDGNTYASKTGYTFDSWCSDKSLATTVTSIPAKTRGTQTFYAKWTANNYNLTFNANGGSVSPESIQVTYDQQVGPLPTPTRGGYTFDAWYDNTIGGTKYTSETVYKVADNTTLYARWNALSYTITIEPNGGNIGAYDNTYTVGSEQSKTIPNPTRNGYTFVGWTVSWTDSSNHAIDSLKPTISGTSTSLSIPTDCYGNITLTANWSVVEYTISYILNDGAWKASFTPTTKYTIESATITLPTSANIERVGYTFAGWYENASFSGSVVTTIPAGSTTGNKTYYARWNANTGTPYTVNHYQEKIGISSPSESTASHWDLADTEPLTGTTGASVTPSVKSYTGFTAPTAKTVIINADGSTVVNYYYTRDSYILTLKNSTGISSVSGNGTYDYAQNITATATVSAGYTFSLWTSSNATLLPNSNNASYTFNMPAGAVTLTASATANEYKITFDKQKGTGGTDSVTAIFGSAMPTASAPTRTGYTFGGYFTQINGGGTQYYTASMASKRNWDIAQPTTLYAMWTANTYTVTYNGNGHTAGTTANSTHTYDVEKQLTANGYTRSYLVTYNYNYSGSTNSTATATATFNGWATTAGGAKVYENQQIVKNLTYINNLTVTLYANWTLGSVTLPTPTRTGYTFAGWYDSATGGTKIGDGGQSYTPTTAKTLYARWNSLGVSVSPSKTTATLTYGYQTTDIATITASGGGGRWIYSLVGATGSYFALSNSSATTSSVTLIFNAGASVGSYTVKVKATSTYNGLSATTETITVNVDKKALTITADSASKVYNGTPLTKNTFTSSGLLSGHTISSCTITGTITNVGSVDNVPSGAVVMSGTTNVTNNYAITYINGTLTVIQATGYITLDPTSSSVVYKTATKAFSVASSHGGALSATDNNATATVSVVGTTVTISNLSTINAGTVIKVTVTCAATQNYTSASATFTLTIDKADIAPTVSMSGYTYGGTKSEPSINGNTGNGSVTYYYNTTNSNSGGTAWTSVTSSTYLNVGTYYIYAVVSATTNYNGATTPAVRFTISKGAVTAPTTISVDKDGVVTWSGATNATGYEISINGTTWTSATSGIDYLSTIIEATGTRTIYVRAINSDSTNYTTPSDNKSTSVNVYTLTINSNNSNYGTVSPATINVISGSTFTTSANVLTLTRQSKTEKSTATPKANPTGFTHSFSNWSPLSGTITKYTTVTANFRITANTFVVTLDKQSGTGGTDSVTATYGRAMPTATAPTRTGYTFGGYFTQINGGGTQYYTASMASKRNWDIAQPTTLYAKWTLTNYIIDIDENGGNAVTNPSYTMKSTAQKITIPIPNRANFVFEKWTVAWGTGQHSSILPNLISNTQLNIPANCYGNVTLTAQWSPAEARIGSTYYKTLEEAILNVADQETITIVASSITLENTQFIYKNVSITADVATTIFYTNTSAPMFVIGSDNLDFINQPQITPSSVVVKIGSSSSRKITFDGNNQIYSSNVFVNIGTLFFENVSMTKFEMNSPGDGGVGLILNVYRNSLTDTTIENNTLNSMTAVIIAMLAETNEIGGIVISTSSISQNTLHENSHLIYSEDTVRIKDSYLDNNICETYVDSALLYATNHVTIGGTTFRENKVGFLAYLSGSDSHSLRFMECRISNNDVKEAVLVLGGNASISGGEFSANKFACLIFTTGSLTLRTDISDDNVKAYESSTYNGIISVFGSKIIVDGGTYKPIGDFYTIDGTSLGIEINGGTFYGKSINTDLSLTNNNLDLKNNSTVGDIYVTTNGDSVININSSSVSLNSIVVASGTSTYEGNPTLVQFSDSVYSAYAQQILNKVSIENTNYVAKLDTTNKRIYIASLQFTITYKSNGSGEADATQTVNYGKSFTTKPSKTFTRSGYTFVGWSTSASAWEGNYQNAGTSYIYNETANITLYAIWRENASYLHNGWKNQISNVSSLTSIEFTNDNTGLTGTPIQIGATDETSSAYWADGNTSCFGVYAYLSGTTLKIYSPVTIYAPQDCSYLFEELGNVTSIMFNNWNSSKTQNMQGMFVGCQSLKVETFGQPGSFGLYSFFDTSNVTNMTLMFSRCSSLSALSLFINTRKVTNMSSMFTECYNLRSVSVGDDFVTDKVTNMSGMFMGCRSLDLNIITYMDFSNLQNASSMFQGCNTLYEFNFINFAPQNLKDTQFMFWNCSNLAEINMSNWNMAQLTDSTAMFEGCSALTTIHTPQTVGASIELPFSDFYTLETNNIRNCTSITSDFEGLTIKRTTGMASYLHNGWQSQIADTLSLTSIEFTNDNTGLSGTPIQIGATDETSSANWTEANTNCFGVYAYLNGTTLKVYSPVTIYAPQDSSGLFANLDVYSITFDNFDTSKVTNMSYMFYECMVLETLNLNKFNTSKVTNMSYMFWQCRSLLQLEISSFNTSSVLNMQQMFYGCNCLNDINLSNFDTSKVTNMESMFVACSNLTTLNLLSFYINSGVTTTSMLYGCASLTTIHTPQTVGTSIALPFSDFYTIENPPRACPSITSYFESLTIKRANGMASYLSKNWKTKIPNATSLTSIEFTSTKPTTGTLYQIGATDEFSTTDWSTSYTSCFGVYAYLSGTTLKIYSPATIYAPQDSSYLISAIQPSGHLTKLTNITLRNFDTSKVTDMNFMFGNCTSLTQLDLSNFYMSEVTSVACMFQNCNSLISLNLSNFDTSSVKNMVSMFGYCSSLTILNLSNFDTSSVARMNSMFYNCSALTELNLSGFTIKSGATTTDMFTGCNALKVIHAPKTVVTSISLPTTFYKSTSTSSTPHSAISSSNQNSILVRTGYYARIGDTYYTSLTSAITSATTGATIELLRTTTISAAITISKNFTIKPLGNVGIQGTVRTYLFNIISTAKLTLTTDNNFTLTINNKSTTSTSSTIYIVGQFQGKLNISGNVTISSRGGYAIWLPYGNRLTLSGSPAITGKGGTTKDVGIYVANSDFTESSAIILAGDLTPQDVLNIEFMDTIAGGGIIINGSSSATMDVDMVNAKSVGFNTYYVGEYGVYIWYVDKENNYSGCFTSDTYVTIWDEKKKKLRRKKAKKLTYKDKLLVWNFDKGCFEFVNALWIQKEKVADKYTLIKFSDGSKLKVVQDHAVFNYDKQMFCPICSNQAWGCPIGTRVVRDDGKIVTIVSKKVINKKVEYTNIFSKYHMNIYTSGILTSTAFNNMYKIENMKYVKDVEKKCYNRSLLDGISKEWIEGMRLEEFPDNILIEGIKHFANCKTFKDYIDMKIEEQKFD